MIGEQDAFRVAQRAADDAAFVIGYRHARPLRQMAQPWSMPLSM